MSSETTPAIAYISAPATHPLLCLQLPPKLGHRQPVHLNQSEAHTKPWSYQQARLPRLHHNVHVSLRQSWAHPMDVVEIRDRDTLASLFFCFLIGWGCVKAVSSLRKSHLFVQCRVSATNYIPGVSIRFSPSDIPVKVDPKFYQVMLEYFYPTGEHW
jgi:hypothetical protein